VSEARDLLASLRDIVEPAPPTSTAPWLVLATLGLSLLLIAALFHRWQRRRKAWLKESLLRLRTAESAAPEHALLECARVLRQVMRHHLGSTVDGLHGEEWLECLANAFDDQWFLTDEGRIFGQALYHRDATRELDSRRLCGALARRLKRLPASRARTSLEQTAVGEAS